MFVGATQASLFQWCWCEPLFAIEKIADQFASCGLWPTEWPCLAISVLDSCHRAPNGSDWFGSKPRIRGYLRLRIMFWMACNPQLKHPCIIRIGKSVGSPDTRRILRIVAASAPIRSVADRTRTEGTICHQKKKKKNRSALLAIVRPFKQPLWHYKPSFLLTPPQPMQSFSSLVIADNAGCFLMRRMPKACTT